MQVSDNGLRRYRTNWLDKERSGVRHYFKPSCFLMAFSKAAPISLDP